MSSGKQKLHDVFECAVLHISVRTQLVLTEVFHGSLQSHQSYTQAVPHTMPGHPFQFDLCQSSCHFILHKPKDSVKRPRLTVRPYCGSPLGNSCSFWGASAYQCVRNCMFVILTFCSTVTCICTLCNWSVYVQSTVTFCNWSIYVQSTVTSCNWSIPICTVYCNVL